MCVLNWQHLSHVSEYLSIKIDLKLYVYNKYVLPNAPPFILLILNKATYLVDICILKINQETSLVKNIFKMAVNFFKIFLCGPPL